MKTMRVSLIVLAVLIGAATGSVSAADLKMKFSVPKIT